ncbi:dTMP kinase [Methylocella silvestris BL2]|uniref:Thymidylate kinase n=1 Tax=Methylocella silvestris (strain DSM 15510 / CIP 108128 / LMG 27833 / NCIMB 13906 / BL2) TaxID=395965 RepID=B8ELC6_METSB|nr:dTMP kinase [Methylocella silvestris]ACK49515.1 dTMP kinase [Methylocella silvestris BL2]
MSQTNDPAPSSPRRGRLITLEGGEGVGKSTQIGRLLQRLRDEGIEAVATREPGGSEGAEILRRVLLSGVVKPLGPAAEAILFAAARIDHIDALIEPALAAGIWVVSDRFADSTRAYQGGAGSLDNRLINALERTALGDLQPDLTLILDLPPGEGLRRAAARRKDADGVDRFEGEDLRFHEAIRAAFLTIAADNPQRCVVVDASASEVEVAAAIWTAVSDRLLKERELDRAHGS